MRTLCVLATAYHLTHANIISGPSSYTIVTQASSRTEVNLPGDKQAITFAKSPLLDDFHSNRVHDACETGHPVLFWLQQHCGVERGVRTWLGGFGWPDCAWSHTKLGWECHSFVRSKVAKLDIALALSLPPAKFRESERRGRCRCQRRIRKTRRSWETWERKSELWWWNGRFLWLVHALVRGAEVSKRLLGWLSRSKGFGRKYK